MASAEQIYADPSALAKLYLHEPRSKEMAAWRGRLKGSLPVTHHGRVELITSIALARFRGAIDEEQASLAWQSMAADFADGYLTQVDILWRAALNRAGELSREHGPKIGTRSLDVLHVACALELGLSHFLTFDGKQQALAKVAGLKAVLAAG